MRVIEGRLAGALDGHLHEWQAVLETAIGFTARCGAAYRTGARARRLLNTAVFVRIEVRDGHVAGFSPLRRPARHAGVRILVVMMPPDTNHPVTVPGEPLRLDARRRRATCRDEVLAAMRRLEDRTGETVFTVTRVFAEMRAHGTAYKRAAVAK